MIFYLVDYQLRLFISWLFMVDGGFSDWLGLSVSEAVFGERRQSWAKVGFYLLVVNCLVIWCLMWVVS